MTKHNKHKKTPAKPKPTNSNNSFNKLKAMITKTESTGVNPEALQELEQNKTNISKEKEKDFTPLLEKMDILLNEISRIKESENKARNSAIEDKKVYEELRKESEKELKESQTEKKNWQQKNKILSNKETELAQLERELFEKELEAELGFVKKNRESLLLLTDEKEILTTELKELKETIKSTEVKWKTKFEQQKQQQEAQLQQALTEKQEKAISSIQAKETELEKKEIELETNKEKYKILLRQLNIKKAGIEESIKSQVEIEIKEVIASEAYLNQRIDDLAQQLTEKQHEMDQFDDLKALLDGESPESILTLNQSLKRKVSELTQQINSTPGEDLQESYDDLEAEFEDLTTNLQEKDRELSKLKTKLHQSILHISEHEYSKRMLEGCKTHADMYNLKVKQLKVELGELKEKDNEKQTFKALKAYDEQYKNRDTVYGKEENETLATFVDAIRHQMASQSKLYYPLKTLQLFIAGLAMSKLHILQGISGTGKTSLATNFAKVVNGLDHNKQEKGLQVVAVQAGWRDAQDLLGYFNAFENRYYETDFLKGLYQAQTPEFRDKPYLILLDEMNLSHPEQYFSNLLSAMELEQKSQIISLTSSKVDNAPLALIDDSKIKIPENIWFIGTANHDETTMEFADKTYDRSHLMELPRHKPEKFDVDSNKKCHWTFTNLTEAFKAAEKKHAKEVEQVHDFLEDVAKSHLDNSFDVGFGNRLQRQLTAFVPVLIASGGSIEMAADHILCTKLLRKGKVVGRFDTNANQIQRLIDGINDLWKKAEFKNKPQDSLNLLEKDFLKKS